jgi:hypothetical protein
MSFDLIVVAVAPDATDAQVRAMVQRCRSHHHPDGELDERIVGFYEELRTAYPDFPPYPLDCPWMSMPLAIGIDHVAMTISHSERGSAALDLIDGLARRYELTVYDPQAGEVVRPDDLPTPVDHAILALFDELYPPGPTKSRQSVPPS